MPNSELAQWLDFLREGGVVALTGAGVSTDSGIPDYRDDQGRFKHKQPIDFRDFVASQDVRRRYWARSMVGYARMHDARPNGAHRALRDLEQKRAIDIVITQNVDGLHQRAGSEQVIDLHGRIDSVVCLDCRSQSSREALQDLLLRGNPDWLGRAASERAAPDGDAIVERGFQDFEVPVCPRCEGMLKPDVVFFGEHVPSERTRRAAAAVESARALLVVGSSLMVFSGFRFVRQATKLGLPVLVVNRGATRADSVATLRVHANAGEFLGQLCAALGER